MICGIHLLVSELQCPGRNNFITPFLPWKSYDEYELKELLRSSVFLTEFDLVVKSEKWQIWWPDSYHTWSNSAADRPDEDWDQTIGLPSAFSLLPSSTLALPHASLATFIQKQKADSRRIGRWSSRLPSSEQTAYPDPFSSSVLLKVPLTTISSSAASLKPCSS